MTGFRRVASVDDISFGKGIVVQVDGKQIAVFNVKGLFYAIDNTCPHRGGPLGEGSLRGTMVNCPWHGAQFDVTSGQVLGPPAPGGVTCYSTKVEEGSVWVALS
jgi:nitrite reductase (NADH) small subunit/3-phenylpropionate/trans-cinnamate dioxygenase ferredoxin subunit